MARHQKNYTSKKTKKGKPKLFAWKLDFMEWLKKEIFFVRLALLLTLMLSIFIIGLGLIHRFKHQDESIRLGTSFSVKYAEELNLDWKQTYLAILDELEVKNLRLMSYWDIHEAERDVLDFSQLDWQMDQAERHNAKVALAIGQRQPRWPECHVPAWAEELEENEYRSELLVYISTVVERYKDSEAIDTWQLENEAANSIFGECSRDFDGEFLKTEYELVKAADPSREVAINASSQRGVPFFGQIGDKVGYSVYWAGHYQILGINAPWTTQWIPSWWHGFKSALVEGIHGSRAFAHEVQAEPWGPRPTVNLSIEEQNNTMSPETLREITQFTVDTGMREIYLWGAEWWYWRAKTLGEPDMWQAADELYSKFNQL